MKATYFGTTTLLFDDGKDQIRPGFNSSKGSWTAFLPFPIQTGRGFSFAGITAKNGEVF